MGVLKKELGENNIFITQTLPEVNKSMMKDLKSIIESDIDNQKLSDTNNEIGFYVSCQLGLVFSHKNLVHMIVAYRNFRNSIMIAYDVNKSAYGLNPLKCYRLSAAAIEALNLNDPTKLTDQLVQDQIRVNNINIASFIEEIPMKIHRSHLLQAFLFDHIQPHMPAFNTNVLKLGGTSSHLTSLLYKSSE